jgi:hypothetical protein
MEKIDVTVGICLRADQRTHPTSSPLDCYVSTYDGENIECTAFDGYGVMHILLPHILKGQWVAGAKLYNVTKICIDSALIKREPDPSYYFQKGVLYGRIAQYVDDLSDDDQNKPGVILFTGLMAPAPRIENGKVLNHKNEIIYTIPETVEGIMGRTIPKDDLEINAFHSSILCAIRAHEANMRDRQYRSREMTDFRNYFSQVSIDEFIRHDKAAQVKPTHDLKWFVDRVGKNIRRIYPGEPYQIQVTSELFANRLFSIQHEEGFRCSDNP